MKNRKSLAVVTLGASMFVIAGCGKHEPAEAPAPAAAAPAAPVAAAAVPLERLEMAPADVPAGGNCSLDTINGQPVAAAVGSLRAGEAATFVGWAGDPEGQVPTDVRLVLSNAEGAFAAAATTGTDRPDVAAALGKPGLARAGLSVSTTLPEAPGNYRVSVLMGSPAAFHCQFEVEIPLAAS